MSPRKIRIGFSPAEQAKNDPLKCAWRSLETADKMGRVATQASAGNAFEVLCLWASQNRWCWKIPCTTCGNQKFRIGLLLIARGIPLDAWDHKAPGWPRGLLPMPRGGRVPLWKSDSRRLGRVLGEAGLAAIRKDYVAQSKSGVLAEGWLGYLGVALERPALRPAHKDKVAIAWRGQLDRMAGLPGSSASPVTFAELERYEKRLTLGAS